MSKYAGGIFVAENEMRQHRLLGNAEHFFQKICSSRENLYVISAGGASPSPTRNSIRKLLESLGADRIRP